ncbi:hypothetical protein [Streptomyces sp. NPDC031705]|uniref:hypothetical protein n=1 Tax=Streptomyces sp. NPDC031705 TaxID=3155729 RepID=UPI0033F57CBC
MLSPAAYAAIYSEDAINHHRSFIARRRALRPGEEYREPTAQEWDFVVHFELRKVALGVWARDFVGTPASMNTPASAALSCGRS